MNPYKMIVAFLDVQDVLPHAPHRLLTEVWDALGLSFLPFVTGYIQTLLYTVITAAGITPGPTQTAAFPREAPRAPSSTSLSPSH